MTSIRQDGGGSPSGEEIAHHGHRDDGGGCGPEALQAAEDAEHRHAGCHHAQQGGHDVNGGTSDEWEASADDVGEGADDELADCQADESSGERELHCCRGCVQIVDDRRQRRQIHVDGQRTESDQRPEDQDDPQTFGRGGFSAGLGGRLVERTSGRCDCLFGGMRHQQDSNRTDGYVPGVMYSS